MNYGSGVLDRLAAALTDRYRIDASSAKAAQVDGPDHERKGGRAGLAVCSKTFLCELLMPRRHVHTLAPIAILCVALAAPGPARARQIANAADVQAAVDSVFAEYDRTNSPGCAVGVIHDGRLVYARGYGMANLDLGSAIAPTSVFRIASTSKQFTAGVMVLAYGGAGDLLLLVPSLFMTADVYDRPAIVFGWSQAGMLLPRLRPSQRSVESRSHDSQRYAPVEGVIQQSSQPCACRDSRPGEPE